MADARNTGMLFAQSKSADSKAAEPIKQPNPLTHQKQTFTAINSDYTFIEEVSDQTHKKLLISEANRITLVNLSTKVNKSFPIDCAAMTALPQGRVAIGLRGESTLRIYETPDLDTSSFSTITLSSPAKKLIVLDSKHILILDKYDQVSILNTRTNRSEVIFDELHIIKSVVHCINGDVLLHGSNLGIQKVYRVRLKPSFSFLQMDLNEDVNLMTSLEGDKIATLSKGDKLTLWKIEERSLAEDDEDHLRLKFTKLHSIGSDDTPQIIKHLYTLPHNQYLVGHDQIHSTLRFWEITAENKFVNKDTIRLPENENYLRAMKVLQDGSIALVTRNFLLVAQYGPQQQLQETIRQASLIVRGGDFRNLTQHPPELRLITASYLFRETKPVTSNPSDAVNSGYATASTPGVGLLK